MVVVVVVLLVVVVGEPTTALDQGSFKRPPFPPVPAPSEAPDFTFNFISHRADWRPLRLCPHLASPHPVFFLLSYAITQKHIYASASHCPLARLRGNTTTTTALVATAVMEKLRASFWAALGSHQPSLPSPSVSPLSVFFWSGDHTDVTNHIQAVWLWWAHFTLWV